jgi:hypothetical protein
MGYSDVCEAKTKKEMVRRFEELLGEVVTKFGGTKQSQRAVQLRNVGYFAGYYDSQVASNVKEWLDATHPIFGDSRPTPKEAFRTGFMRAGRRKPRNKP